MLTLLRPTSSPAMWLSVSGLAVTILLFAPSPGTTQVIRSYESLDRSAGNDYYATVVFGVDGAIGNSEFVDADFSGAIGYRGDSQWVRFYPAYRLKRSKGENVVHDRSAHIRHSFLFTERSRTFAFVQVQADESIELKRRLLIGGGVRYQVFRFDSGGLDVGAGLMLDEERRVNATEGSDMRGANLLSIYGEVGVVKLSGATYFQPVVSDWGDQRILMQLSGTVPLGTHVGIELSGYWRRDSKPPNGVKRHDAGIEVGFRLDAG